jgi:hypothetical protein
MDVAHVTAELQRAAREFLVPLRLREGYSEDKFLLLCNALRNVAAAWRNSDAIPKSIAIELVDLSPALEACSYLYRDEERKQIVKASDTVADLVRDCVVAK